MSHDVTSLYNCKDGILWMHNEIKLIFYIAAYYNKCSYAHDVNQ